MPPTPQRLIHHFLEESSRSFPDKVALIHGDIRSSYAQINTRANQLARWLIEQGVTQGERVVLLLENSLEYVIGYYGVLKAGAVVAPVSTDIKQEQLTYLLEQVTPAIVISSSKFENILQKTDLMSLRLKALILKTPSLPWGSNRFQTLSWEEIIHGEDCPDPAKPMQDSALATIIYTSGSTGKPKGVMLSHSNIVSNTVSICTSLSLTAEDIQMVVLPFFYVMGKSLLNTHFSVGATLVINNAFLFPASVIKQMVEENVTGFSGVPSTYAFLLHRSPLAGYRDKLESLRYCSQAGGHMPRVVKEGLRKVLPPHTRIYIMYGATEAGARLSCLDPEQYADKMDSIGKAIPSVTLRVVDERANKVPVGQIGELVASGPNIMQGYWRDEEATAKVICGPWYHTGDQAYQDEEGYFYVVGRKDDLLKVGGHRINPRELEDVLAESGAFMEAVVLGLPDGLLGHKLVALAVAKNHDPNLKEILAYCAGKLPKYKLPATVQLVRALPKNASGKIDRARCLELMKSQDPDHADDRVH
jgi:long-chain acyl-CoA synthetase